MPGVRVRGADVEDNAFVRCRSYGHAWDEYYPIDMAAPSFGWRLSLRCMRCATERHDNYDFKGRVMNRRYIYPEGYQTPKGEEKPSKEFFREELFTRLRKQLSEHSALGKATAQGTVTPISAATTPKARKRA
jgi:hypothetical protein